MSNFECLPGPAEDFGDKAPVGAILDVLANPKLLKLILSNTGSDDYGYIDKKLAYHLALVCKGLKDVALDMLWESMDSYIPLLKLLPGLKTGGVMEFFTGNIDDSPFEAYAGSIRRLRLGKLPKATTTFSAQLYTRLAKQLAGSPLLPNLSRLDVEQIDPGTRGVLPLIIASSLEDIRFYGEALSGKHLAASLFATLPLDAPLLRRLTLQHENMGFNLEQSILAMISKLKHLEVLEIQLPGTIVDPSFVRGIGANFPKLKRLKLDIHFHHEYVANPSFPLLKDCVCPHEAEAASGSFSPTHQSLQDFHITLRIGSTYHSATAPQICPAIPAALLSHLTVVTIQASYGLIFLPPQLPSLSSLRSVMVRKREDSFITFRLKDLALISSIGSLEEFMLEITDVMPFRGPSKQGLLETFIDLLFSGDHSRSHLRTLILPAGPWTSRYSGVQETRTSPTLTSLQYVATDAGSLQRLRLCLDSGGSTIDPAIPTTTSPLKLLEISDTRPLNNPFALMEHSKIAHYLDRLFPNLESVKPYRDARGVGGNHEESWRFIDHFRHKIKLLREQRNRST